MFLPIRYRPARAGCRRRHGRRRLLSVLIGLGLFPGIVSAYSQLVVFGDSLSDSGQFPDAASLAQGELGSLRFTNRVGPSYQAPAPYAEVSTQRLAEALELGPLVPSTSVIRDQLGLPDGSNYATGGYTTDAILASIIQPGGSVVSRAGLTLRTRDGYLVTVGAADSEALYYLNGGGNDFLDGGVTGPAAATASGGTLADGVDALVAAGTRTLVVANLADVGAAPIGLVSGQRDAFSRLVQVYNQALGERLSRYDGQVDIIRLNVDALFEEVLARPADFGLAGNIPLSNVCFSDPACDVSSYGLAMGNPDPDRLLFNDTVHPTTAGQTILANYAYALIAAPRILSLAGKLATGAINSQQQTLVNELRPGQQSESVRVFVHGDYRNDQPDSFSVDGMPESSQQGAGVGLVVPLGQGWLGAAVAQREAEFEAPADFYLEGPAVSLFTRQHLGRIGVQAIVSHGDFDLDLRRRVMLGQTERTLTGATEAKGWAAELRLDYRVTASDSPWYSAPFVAYRHSDAKVDGYREQGSVANALIVSAQEVENRQVELGLMMDRSPVGGLGFFGELAWGGYLEDRRESAEVRLASLPTNRWSGEGRKREDDDYLRFDTGLRMHWGDVRLQAGAGVQGWSEPSPHFQLGAGFVF